MTEVAAIAAVAAPIAADPTSTAPATAQIVPASFESLLASGLQNVDAKVAHSDALVRQFAIDGSVPLHQVTIALEEARISVELAMQMRARLVEGYRELMNMQL